MAFINVNPKYGLVLRKDVMANKHFSLHSRLVFSSLLAMQKHNPICLSSFYTAKMFGIEMEDVQRSVDELASFGLINVLNVETDDKGRKNFFCKLLPMCNLLFDGALMPDVDKN